MSAPKVGWFKLLGLVLLLLIIYVLSIGPAVRYWPVSMERYFEYAYAPLELTTRNSLLRSFIDSYIEWWRLNPTKEELEHLHKLNEEMEAEPFEPQAPH